MNLLTTLQWWEGVDIVRKWKHDFELQWQGVLSLTRDIWRRIWFCFYAQKISRSMLYDPENNEWSKWQNLLLKILLESNCHWVVSWFMNRWQLACQGYNVQFDDLSAHYEYRPKFNSTDLVKMLKENKFPIFATSWSDDYFSHDHSIVILWRWKTEEEFIIFEKQWIQSCPFRLYTEKLDKLKHNYVAFTT